MYKISIPLMTSTINKKNRDKYLELCRRAGAERIFLATGSIMLPPPENMRETVEFFRSHGYEVGIWTDTIGHGSVLEHVQNKDDTPSFTQMVNIMGEERPHANCPMDEGFSALAAERIAKFADMGVDIVMLDDDFRMSQHGKHLCCGCHRHLARMSEILSEDVTLDTIRPYVLTGKSNKYRNAWVTAQNDGLVRFAKIIRAKVDEVAPHVTVCICTASAPWNVDNTDVVGITKILAGDNSPLLRLTGAPYWAYFRTRRFSLITVIEIARMLASFVENSDIELMSEGDVYPRPRYTCPASYLELYDVATRADGAYDGILKYMFDYVAGPELETGYLKIHEADSKLLERTCDFFKDGANSGVRIITYPHTFKDADLGLSSIDDLTPHPIDGAMYASCGIPTIYRGKGLCSSVFGENARHVDTEQLRDGVILDAVAAIILTERGIDVGLRSYTSLEEKKISYLCNDDPEYKSYVTDGAIRYLGAELNDGATPLLFSTTPTGKDTVAYSYENQKGERFMVFLFEGDSMYSEKGVAITGLIKNYVTQKALIDTLPWVAKKPLPAYCFGNPELQLMCSEGEDTLSIALLNCFSDAITEPVIHLGQEYSRIECVGCTAALQDNKVIITSKLHGFSAALLKLYK